MKLLCRLGWHSWLYDRHYTSLGILETDCVMVCGNKLLKYRNCSRCNLFQVCFEDDGVYEGIGGGVVLRLREDWEEEILSKDKIYQLEKLKLKVISQNPRGLMIPFPVPDVPVVPSDVVKKCEVRSIDDGD